MLLALAEITDLARRAKLANAAGASEMEWQVFFEKQCETLEMELVDLASAILAAQTNELDSHE